MPLTILKEYSVSYLQILDDQGNADPKLDPGLKDDELLEIYRWMVLAREADQRQLKLQRQGRMGTFPLCTGQEAAACGTTFALSDKDWFVGSYRELGGRLMRGMPLKEYYQFWNGFEEGNTTPEKGRTLPIQAVVGAQVLHAVGVAYATKLRKEHGAVITFFGDGASSEGDVHEAMNFASVWQAPVVFICLNNQWAISLPRDTQTHSETIAQKAIGYGFEGIQVDGNDVLAVYRATNAALERARDGGGPTLIEAVTYRLMMHTTADDPKRYRNDDEVNSWWKKDPIPRFRLYLEKKGIWDTKLQKELEVSAKQQVDDVVKTFGDIEVKPDAPFDHVWGTKHTEIEEQREQFLADLARENRQETTKGLGAA